MSARDLRTRAAEVFRAVREGQTVTLTLTYRGAPVAEIRPISKGRRPITGGDDVFGMWRVRRNLGTRGKRVRASRRGRMSRSSSTRTS